MTLQTGAQQNRHNAPVMNKSVQDMQTTAGPLSCLKDANCFRQHFTHPVAGQSKLKLAITVGQLASK